MNFPDFKWSLQEQITFSINTLGYPSIACNGDSYIYFAAVVKGTNPNVTSTPPVGVGNVYNIVIGKYNRFSLNLVWYKYFDTLVTTLDSTQVSILLGTNNDLYVSFTTEGSTASNLNMSLVPSFGPCNCPNAGNEDVVLARVNLSDEPTVAWVSQSAYLNSVNNEYSPQIALDPVSGLVYITYECSANILCYPVIGQTNILVACYDINGNQLWIETTTTINSSGQNQNPTIAADASGGVYVAYETDKTVQGGAVISSQQIEMVKFQTFFNGDGSFNGHNREWILSSVSNIFSTGVSFSPTITYKNSFVYLAFTTTGNVGSNTQSSASPDIVFAAFQQNGTIVWLRQGSLYNQSLYQFQSAYKPYIIVDNYNNVFVSALTISAGYENVLFYKLNTQTGLPIYNQDSFNVYPFARQLTPNTVFPKPAFSGAFSKTILAFANTDMYVLLNTTQKSPGHYKENSEYDLCLVAFDHLNILPLTTPFSFMTNNKSICACSGPCGCSKSVYQVVYDVILALLSFSSENLSSSWNVWPDINVIVKYYETTSSFASGGTLVGQIQTVNSGVYINSLTPAYQPVIGKYYYVGVTPPNGVEEFCDTALFMPGLFHIYMEPLTFTSDSLTIHWESTGPYRIGIQFHEIDISEQTYSSFKESHSGEPFGDLQIVEPGIYSYTHIEDLRPGNYYYFSLYIVEGQNFERMASIPSVKQTEKAQQMLGVYNITFESLHMDSKQLQASWMTTEPYELKVQFYETLSSSPIAGIPIGEAQIISPGIYTTSIQEDLVPGKHYYVGITKGGCPERFSKIAEKMLGARIRLNTLTLLSTNLSSSWVGTGDYETTLQYYETTSSDLSGGIPFGPQETLSAGTSYHVLEKQPIVGKYYYVGLTAQDSEEQYNRIALEMPGLYFISMEPLSLASTDLFAYWETTEPYDVTLQYYEYDTEDNKHGTPFGPLQFIVAGTKTHILYKQPTPGKYYSIGIKIPGCVEQFNNNITYMSVVYGISIANVAPYFSVSWSATEPMPVSLQFYESVTDTPIVNTINEGESVNKWDDEVQPSRITFGKSIQIDRDITSYTLRITPTAGNYYYVGITATDACELFSAVLKYEN